MWLHVPARSVRLFSVKPALSAPVTSALLSLWAARRRLVNHSNVLFHSRTRSMTRSLRLMAVGAALLVVPMLARAQDGVRTTAPYDPKALDAPKPFAAFSASAMSLRDSLVALALKAANGFGASSALG